jgi:hypothetical protein
MLEASTCSRWCVGALTAQLAFTAAAHPTQPVQIIKLGPPLCPALQPLYPLLPAALPV